MLLSALALAETPVVAPTDLMAVPRLADIEEGRRADQELRAHLWRVNALGGASLLAGAGLTAFGWNDERLRWAGISSMGSGVIDLAIGAPPLFAAPATLTPAEIAQNREIIALNVGLDVAYVAAGLLMGFLAEDQRVQGAGWGLAAQGVSLTVLDGVVWARLPTPVQR